MYCFGRYYLTGPKSGSLEVFADNLPGLPDNIRQSRSGGFWVGTASFRREEKFSLIDFAMTRPWLRDFTSRVSHFLSNLTFNAFADT